MKTYVAIETALRFAFHPGLFEGVPDEDRLRRAVRVTTSLLCADELPGSRSELAALGRKVALYEVGR